MDAEGKGEKSTTFRWINLARYVVASVMTVLIATVVVIAIKMVLRPDPLIVAIVDGSISVKQQPPNQLQFVFDLYTYNPSGRAIMYYYNIKGYLFDKNISASTLDPLNDSFFAFDIKNKTLLQQQEKQSFTQSTTLPDSMAPSYFDMMYYNSSAGIYNVTMRMDGYLVTESFSGYNTSARWTKYYCSPLVVGQAPAHSRGGQDDDEANKNTQGSVPCTAVADV